MNSLDHAWANGGRADELSQACPASVLKPGVLLPRGPGARSRELPPAVAHALSRCVLTAGPHGATEAVRALPVSGGRTDNDQDSPARQAQEPDRKMGLEAEPGHLLTKVFLKAAVAFTNTAISVSVWQLPVILRG